ncbi:hypothetical protein [Clostridium perfringens]|uniref:hypothetical protein n=2 Tax=Clostridium perfringens TaxID=1502 RepID=UPI00111521D5|nr:hypothetical protein [Clostridium perfringens]
MLGKQIDVRYKTLCKKCHKKEHNKSLVVRRKKNISFYNRKPIKSLHFNYNKNISCFKNKNKLVINEDFLDTPIALPIFAITSRKVIRDINLNVNISPNRKAVIKVYNNEGIPHMVDLNILIGLYLLSNGESNKINFSFSKISKVLSYTKLSGNSVRYLYNSILKLYDSKIEINIFEKDNLIHSFVGSIIEEFQVLNTDNIYKVNPYKVQSLQYVIINKYFYDSLNYILNKIDFNIYNSLKTTLSKKIYLSLNFKDGFFKYEDLFSYLGVPYNAIDEKYYAVKQIKKSLIELADNRIISNYQEEKGVGVYILFNKNIH